MILSTDTNIWLDFDAINELVRPLTLPDQIYVTDLTYRDEIAFYPALKAVIDEKVVTPLHISEVQMMPTYQKKYPRLSQYDIAALLVAKCRKWTLLSGDRWLFKAAVTESVECHGTLWVYDRLLVCGLISTEEYSNAMRKLLAAVKDGRRRLPIHEIERRIVDTPHD